MRAGEQGRGCADRRTRAGTWAARRPHRSGPMTRGRRRGTGSPKRRISPAAGARASPSSIRMVVVLPDPLGPRKPCTPPARDGAGRGRGRPRTWRPRRSRNSLRSPLVSMTRSGTGAPSVTRLGVRRRLHPPAPAAQDSGLNTGTRSPVDVAPSPRRVRVRGGARSPGSGRTTPRPAATAGAARRRGATSWTVTSPAELGRQRGDAGVADAAGHEAVVPAEVDVAVEREAVHGDAAADPDADRGDLALGTLGRRPGARRRCAPARGRSSRRGRCRCGSAPPRAGGRSRRPRRGRAAARWGSRPAGRGRGR